VERDERDVAGEPSTRPRQHLRDERFRRHGGLAGDPCSAAVGVVGAGLTAAGSHHTHQITTGTPVDIGSANAAGAGTALARHNHVHRHGSHTDPTNHALADNSNAGFMSPAQVAKLAGIEAGAQVTTFARVAAALAAATSDIDVNGYKITGLGAGTAPSDAVNVAQLTAAMMGFDLKVEARGASLGNQSLSGPLTEDGITYADGDRYLAKDQTDPTENGLYLVDTGAGWVRTTDADVDAEVTPGLFVFVLEGTVNARTGWALLEAGPYVLGTTALSFTQMFGPGAVIAGAGLTQTGNTINVVAADGSISVGANSLAVGVISDAQHGTRGGGTTHAAAVASGAAGFITGADQAKLNGIEAGAQVTSFARVAAALAAAAADIAVNGVKITGLADGTNPQDAVTLAQLTATAYGFDWKVEVRGASTANAALSGALTDDGVTYVTGDRFLAKNQSTPSQNGIWVVNTAGAWARAADADSSAEVTPGLFVFVIEGTVNAKTGWALLAAGPYVLGTTALTFTQIFGPGTIIAGAGLTQTGNTIDVVANADGSISVQANDIKVGVLATDIQHGARGNGNLHTVADATHDGFMPQAHWSLVNGATASPTANTLRKGGASGELLGVWFAPSASGMPSLGIYRGAATATLLAVAGASSGDHKIIQTASDEITLGDNAKTAAIYTDVIAGALVRVRINTISFLSVAEDITSFGPGTDSGHGERVLGIAKATTNPTADIASDSFVLYGEVVTGDARVWTHGGVNWTLAPAATGSVATSTQCDIEKKLARTQTTDGRTLTIWSYIPPATASVRARVHVMGRHSDLWISKIRELRINLSAGAPTLTVDTIGTDINTFGGTVALAYAWASGAIKVLATGDSTPNTVDWLVNVEVLETWIP
jgi:hypothetical protein